MENISRAILMAFSMIMFVIGFSYSMYLINKLTTTSNTLLESVTTTNYYDNIEISEEARTIRDVGIDTIIPILYRYSKENYSVKIMIKNGSNYELLQLFDMNIASYNKITPVDDSDKELASLKNSIYNTPSKRAYLFKAPWTSDLNRDAKARIDYFLNGTKGYINNTEVDYSASSSAFSGQSGGFIGYCKNTPDGTSKVFEESFVEYAYEGETISTADRRIGNDNRKYARKFKNYHNV